MFRCFLASRRMATSGGLRLASQYQFKVAKPFYYPDRQAEMKRPPMGAYLQQHETSRTIKYPQNRGMPKDYYYKVLGVNKYATIQQIRSAFYALAKRYHPDSTHSEQKIKQFQELSNAYNILTDETKRLEYDQLGGVRDERAFLEQAGDPIDLETKRLLADKKANDEFNNLAKGLELSLDFVEATLGCKKPLELRYLSKCEACKGKSKMMANRDVGKEPCRRCNGTGKMIVKTVTSTIVDTCSQCNGKRYTNRNDCETCSNRGHVLHCVEVLAPVPPGSRDGDQLSIINPKTRQLVKYRLRVQDSEYFKRDGNDILTEKHLNLSDVILGGTFNVHGLHQSLELRVEPGTQSHTQVVVKGMGVRSQEGVGNHIVTLKVRIPQNLSVKQRQIILALAKTEDPIYEQEIKR
ncbi:chaperone protein DnaJ [Drosophila kikkawai]|uniref:Chaperone protein DnaJ n=1 Tax=Drosophila kikkawai TaxID=30033 RepID=A0A6P4IAD0_DROKI|nr:chaperone protein DnaJ [Drosophila kikkawai]